MPREHVRALMLEVGPLADLLAVGEFEGRDVWTLAIDEETAVDVDLDPARGCLVLSAEVGTPVPADRARWLELVLQYNYQWADTGGARMAVALRDGPFVLLADHPAAGLSAPDLGRWVLTFAGLLRAWREILARAPSDGAGPAAGGDGVRAGFAFPGGMIRA